MKFSLMISNQSTAQHSRMMCGKCLWRSPTPKPRLGRPRRGIVRFGIALCRLRRGREGDAEVVRLRLRSRILAAYLHYVDVGLPGDVVDGIPDREGKLGGYRLRRAGGREVEQLHLALGRKQLPGRDRDRAAAERAAFVVAGRAVDLSFPQAQVRGQRGGCAAVPAQAAAARGLDEAATALRLAGIGAAAGVIDVDRRAIDARGVVIE